MISKVIKINISSELEARPVALLVQIASQYESNIHVEYENKRINAKSIMGMMSMGLSEGKEINILIDGKDEEEALNDIEKYLCGGKAL